MNLNAVGIIEKKLIFVRSFLLFWKPTY